MKLSDEKLRDIAATNTVYVADMVNVPGMARELLCLREEVKAAREMRRTMELGLPYQGWEVNEDYVAEYDAARAASEREGF